MIDPTLTADEITSLVDECKESIPAYHNGEKIDMNAATFNMLKSTKKLTVPQLPATVSGTEATVLPQSRLKATVFVSGKGIEGLQGGEYVTADSEHFQSPSEIVDAARNAFRFNPSLFRKQGGRDGDTITVTIVNLDGKYYTRLTRTYRIYSSSAGYELRLQEDSN